MPCFRPLYSLFQVRINSAQVVKFKDRDRVIRSNFLNSINDTDSVSDWSSRLLDVAKMSDKSLFIDLRHIKIYRVLKPQIVNLKSSLNYSDKKSNVVLTII